PDGLIKSAKEIFGCPGAFFICCRKNSRLKIFPSTFFTSTVSSETALASQKPTTPLAVSHFSLIIFFKKTCASSYSFVAAAPIFSSDKICGNFPCISQAKKKGCQSRYS